MFGIIASGRLVQTDFKMVDNSHYLFDLDDAENIGHLVVFLTGVPFPDGYGGSIYFSWPNSDPTDPSPPGWQYMGYVANHKPSAVFKLAGNKQSQERRRQLQFGGDVSMPVQPRLTAQVGIAIEPLANIEAAMASVDTPTSLPALEHFTQKTVQNLYDFATSFTHSSRPTFSPKEEFIPLSVLERWRESYLRKLRANPRFWQND